MDVSLSSEWVSSACEIASFYGYLGPVASSVNSVDSWSLAGVVGDVKVMTDCVSVTVDSGSVLDHVLCGNTYSTVVWTVVVVGDVVIVCYYVDVVSVAHWCSDWLFVVCAVEVEISVWSFRVRLDGYWIWLVVVVMCYVSYWEGMGTSYWGVAPCSVGGFIWTFGVLCAVYFFYGCLGFCSFCYLSLDSC